MLEQGLGAVEIARGVDNFKFFEIIFIVLTTNMASMSRACKPRIFSFEIWLTKYS